MRRGGDFVAGLLACGCLFSGGYWWVFGLYSGVGLAEDMLYSGRGMSPDYERRRPEVHENQELCCRRAIV